MVININLLPWREERIEQQKQQFIFFISVCAGCAVLLLLTMHFFLSYKTNYQDNLNDHLRIEISGLDQKISSIATLQKEKESLLARMQVIQQLQRDRPKIVKLFDTITRTVPEGLYLTNLTRTGNYLLIEGKAESNTRVSKFMRNMDASDNLTHSVLTFIQADDAEKLNHGIGFSLQVTQRLDS